MTDTACEVCWTSSWAPCKEGTPGAVHDPQNDTAWMVCQMCSKDAAYVGQATLIEGVLASNEEMREDCRAIRGGDVPDDDELRELRAEIFRKAEGIPPESKTSEWADRAQALSEAIDEYCEARILAVGAARTVRLSDAKAEIAALERQRDALLAACEAAVVALKGLPVYSAERWENHHASKLLDAAIAAARAVEAR